MMIWNVAVLSWVLLAGAPEAGDWKEWAPLLGTWEADRSPDGPTGSFTLAPELQGKILFRKNHADYPKTNERPAFRHEDLMTIWRDGPVTRAEYWDSEGHFIRYVTTVESASKTFTFLSEAVQGQPRYRLTYVVSSPSTASLKFEIASPNTQEQYKPYLTATVHRVR